MAGAPIGGVMLSGNLWLPMVRLLRRVTAAAILLAGWQVAVDMVMAR